MTKSYLDELPTLWMKTRKLPVLWKPSSGSPNQCPHYHFSTSITGRITVCMNRRKLPIETSHFRRRPRHLFSKTILDFHPWCVGVRCCPYKNASSIQATLICTWVFTFCRNIQEGINKTRTLLYHYIFYTPCPGISFKKASLPVYL